MASFKTFKTVIAILILSISSSCGQRTDLGGDARVTNGQEQCVYRITVPKSSEQQSCPSFLQVSWDLHDLHSENERLQGNVNALQDQYSELLAQLQDIKNQLEGQSESHNGGDDQTGSPLCQHLSTPNTITLLNLDFENDDSWMDYYTGFDYSTDEAKTGFRSIKVVIGDIGQEGGAKQRLVFPETDQATTMHIKGWSKAVGIEGTKNSDYSIYCDVIKSDGNPSWAHNAPFNVGTHDWEEVMLNIHIPEGIESVTCYALFREKLGTAYFDDFSAEVTTCREYCACN
ncbi:uncharacterized protein LOC144446606 [Glandiceps talaboti]